MSDSRVEVKANMKSTVAPHSRTTYMACTGEQGGVGQVLERQYCQGGYEWLCSKCQGWHFVNENNATQFVPFWHENLGHQPVYIDSWQTYRAHLAAVSPHARNELANS
jgi:hypothetical protein